MNNIERKDLIYKGKAKDIFSCEDENLVIQYFKDDTTANNAQKHSVILGKGEINNVISEKLMTSLQNIGIPTHFIKRLNLREQLVKKVEIIPVEFVIRNIAAGSISKKFGLPVGKEFKKPIVELHISNIYKREEFRQKSLISDVVTGGIFGIGANGYILAIIAMQKMIQK